MEIRGEVLGGGGNNCECSPWPTRASNSREAAGGYDAVEEQIAALLLPTTRQFVRSWTCGGADRADWQPDAPGRWVWVTLRGVGAAAKGALNAKSVHDTFVGKCVRRVHDGRERDFTCKLVPELYSTTHNVWPHNRLGHTSVCGYR